jgi:hypothetical protein
MLVEDALAHFSTRPSGLARLLGISGQAVRKWGPVVPHFNAVKLAQISGYRLRVDPDLYDKHGRARRINGTG